jgi:uncharacterized protein (DUF2062 family)
MLDRFKRLIPSRNAIEKNRWLRWLGPWLKDHRLWHMSRKGIALGMAIGVFFGFLIPFGQIPPAAAVAVLMRANVPITIASTLVTNPVTFGPVYYGAYRLGRFILLEPEPTAEELESLMAQSTPSPEVEALGFIDRMQNAWQRLGQVGKPLFVGLGIVATLSGLLTYALVHWMWLIRVRVARWRRIRKMRNPDARL